MSHTYAYGERLPYLFHEQKLAGTKPHHFRNCCTFSAHHTTMVHKRWMKGYIQPGQDFEKITRLGRGDWNGEEDAEKLIRF